MKKKKVDLFASWWAKAVIIPIIVMPALVFSWKNIQLIWAGPEKVAYIEKKVEKSESVQDQLSKLVVEQQARLDKVDAVTELQIKNLRELLKEMKS